MSQQIPYGVANFQTTQTGTPFAQWVPQYTNIKKRATTSRKKRVTTPAEQLREVQLAKALAAPPSQYLLDLPLSKQPKEDRERATIARLREIDPIKEEHELLKEARSARARIARQTPKQISNEEAALKALHSRKPNIITNMFYRPVLVTYRGSQNYTVKNAKWKDRVPQTLEDEEYNQMAQNVAEMVGVAHLRPEFDKRFLTEKSARGALGAHADNYRYDTVDMDNDVLTPGTLLVYDKDGRMVSAGGYRLPKSTTKQTERLMKDIHYYDSAPTRQARNALPRDVFMYNRNSRIYGPKKQSKNYKFTVISDMIKQYLKNVVGHSQPTAKSPSYIALTRNRTQQDGADPSGKGRTWLAYVYYRLSPPQHLRPMESQPEPLTWTALKELMPGDIIDNNNTIAIPSDVLRADGQLLTKMIYGWQNLFIEPKLEAKILEDMSIQRLIFNYCKAVLNGTVSPSPNVPFGTVIELLCNVVCGLMMRINANVLLSILKISREADARDELLKLLKTTGVVFRFLPDALEEVIDDDDALGIPELPMTALKVDDLFGEDGKATYRGATSRFVNPALYATTLDDVDVPTEEEYQRAMAAQDFVAPQFRNQQPPLNDLVLDLDLDFGPKEGKEIVTPPLPQQQ